MENIKHDEHTFFELIEDKLFNADNALEYESDLDLVLKKWNCCDIEIKNHLFISMLADSDLKNNTNNWMNNYLDVCSKDVGIVFTEGVFDGKFNKCNARQLQFDINNGEIVNKFKEFIFDIHSYGTKIFLTIKPNIGRGVCNFKKLYNYSASFNRNYTNSNFVCARISDGKINELIDIIKNISIFAKEVKFDGLLIDVTEFNILGEMANNDFNKRYFGYYSDIKDCLYEIVNEVNLVIDKYPIFLKITPYNFIDEIYGDIKNEIVSIRKIKHKSKNIFSILNDLVRMGIDGFMFDFGTYETEFLSNPVSYMQENLFLHFYKETKDYFLSNKIKNKYNQDVLLFYKGSVNFNEDVNYLIKNEIINSLDISREYYAGNENFRKIKTQNINKTCIKCCICDVFSQKYDKINCLVNPCVFNTRINKINERELKPIAVIGAGFSGLFAAITLAERGFKVDLYEKNNELNLTGRLHSIYGFNKEINLFMLNIESKLRKFAENNKINIYLNNKFSTENNTQNSYSTIIIATGYKEKFLNISGAVLKNVKSIYEVLNNKKDFERKKNITIYARSELSLQLALYLKTLNKNPNIIIPAFDLFKSLPNSKITYYAYILKKLNINVFMFSKVKKINEDSVDLIINNKLKGLNVASIILNSNSKIKYPYLAEEKNIDSDIFIYEPELYSNNRLFYDLVKANYSGELFMIGNALEIGTLVDDIHSAFYVANNI